MAFDFFQLKKSIQDFGDQVKKQRAAIEQLQRKREDMACAPAAKSDVKAIFDAWISGCVEEYEENLTRQIAPVLRKPHNYQDPKSHSAMQLAVLAVQPGVGSPASARSIDRALMALLGPQLRTELFKLIDAMEWPDEGLPMAERIKKLAEMDASISALQKAEAELVQHAAQARIVID